MTWDPDQYLRFETERSLPFRHLVAAVDHIEPSSIVDLGCGPGGLTASLLDHWPEARITGIDASEEMIERASSRVVANGIEFELAEVLDWQSPKPVDLILSNACFHWIDDHRALFDHLLPQLADDGAMAFQVPANHTEPSHTILGELCSSPRWRDRLDGLPKTGVQDPQWYIEELNDRDLDATSWQTTYFHVLDGDEPILEWVRGTALRPVLRRLPSDDHDAFLSHYGKLLSETYPPHGGRTVFPFKRTFVVGIGGGQK